LPGGTQTAELPRFRVVAGSRRVDLVLKRTWRAELVALQAVRAIDPFPQSFPVVVDGDEDDDPFGFPSGHPLRATWVVTPYYEGIAGVLPVRLPASLFTDLAAMHRSFAGRTTDLTGVIEISPEWFRGLCLDHLLPQVTPPLADHLRTIAADPKVGAALGRLPRTLLHGDVHPGNVLCTGEDAVLVDWANARLGPALVDVANVAERGSPQLRAYLAAAGEAAGEVEVGWWYAKVQINTQYLGWAAQVQGEGAALAMAARARDALERLGAALRE
jgi:hypothetical protein